MTGIATVGNLEADAIGAATEMTVPAGPGAVPRWIHLLPRGAFRGVDGRGPWFVGDLRKIVSATLARAGSRQIPIDYEHQTDLAPRNGMPAPAAGWVDGLQIRQDGLWGRVHWTATAAKHIADKEYRYLSPVFRHASDGTVLAVLRASLTNVPNLDELTALARTESTMDPIEALLPKLRDLLGLPADADPAAILKALGEGGIAANASAPDPSMFVPVGAFQQAVAEVNRLNAGISLQAAQQHVEQQIAAGNIPPLVRDWGVALCRINKPAFDAFVVKTRRVFNNIVNPVSLPAWDASNRPSRLSDEERTVCARMGISDAEYAKALAFSDSGKD